jgi:hypothetical protein
MNLSARYTLSFAVALIALATAVPAALSANGQPLRRGTSDFTIRAGGSGPLEEYGDSYGLAQPRLSGLEKTVEIHLGIRAFGYPAQQLKSNHVVLRGIGDFAAAIHKSKPRVRAPASVAVASARGFGWTDAAIGAAVTLGAVLLVAGLAGVVVLGRPQRRPLRSGVS